MKGEATRLRCLLAKCKARQGTGWKSAEQVQRDWDEARFDVTFMPYLSDDERAERKKFHRDLRAAKTEIRNSLSEACLGVLKLKLIIIIEH